MGKHAMSVLVKEIRCMNSGDFHKLQNLTVYK